MHLIIFDCDGTLVDSQHHIVAAMNMAYSGLGLEPPQPHETLSIVGLSLLEAVTRLCEGRPNAPIAEIAEGYKSSFAQLRAHPEHAPEPLYPGALEVLKALKSHDQLVVGMATGKSRRGVDNVVRLHGLEGHFVTIQTADTSPSKPHPHMIEQAMAEVGVGPEKTLMIGDTSFDMHMAKAAGVYALGVNWGYHPEDVLAAAGADHILRGFEEFLPHLNEKFSLDIKGV